MSEGMKFARLVEKCKNLKYNPKNSDKCDWDYIRESISIALHNEVQLKTLFILTKMFYPIKIITKMLLEDYAKSIEE